MIAPPLEARADAGQHCRCRVATRARSCRTRCRSAPCRASAPFSTSRPLKSHGAAGAFWTTYGAAWPPRSLAAVLHADQLRLRAAEIAPELDAPDPSILEVDAPEEVVRRQEREVAAEISVALDHVVDVRRDVLLVTREDDRVVARGEVVAARDLLQVLVRDVVAALPGVDEEAQKTALLRAVVRRLAVARERAAEQDVVPTRSRRTTSRRGRLGSSRRSCRPASCMSGSRPRRARFRARRAGARTARTRLRGRPARSVGRSTARSATLPTALGRCSPSRGGTGIARGGPHGLPTLDNFRSAPARITCSSSRRTRPSTRSFASWPGAYDVAANTADSAGTCAGCDGAASASRTADTAISATIVNAPARANRRSCLMLLRRRGNRRHEGRQRRACCRQPWGLRELRRVERLAAVNGRDQWEWPARPRLGRARLPGLQGAHHVLVTARRERRRSGR